MSTNVDSAEVLERIRESMPEVNRFAHYYANRMHADADDLRSAALEALLAAARTFDETRGVPFQSWAGLRMRGAMIDYVRSWRIIPRRVAKRLREAGQEIHVTVPMDERLPDDSPRPDDLVDEVKRAARIRAAVAALPPGQRAMIEGAYLDDQDHHDVAAALGISKSWASRHHTKALTRLRVTLRSVAA